MEQTYRAVLIDSAAQIIREIEIETRGESIVSAIQDLVGDSFTVATYIGNDAVYVDDEGLSKGHQHFFEIEGAHQPFAGNGVVLGSMPRTGNTADCRTTMEKLRPMVTFRTVDEVLDQVSGQPRSS